jgi:UDPglucose 6-dehydrogenase
VLITDPPTAETIKYASNAFLATKVSFVNAMANVCEAVGANVTDVMAGMGLDPRIGAQFLRPGPGWGGSCFPKDSHALVRIAEEAGYDFSLLRGVIEVNRAQHAHVVDRVAALVGGDLSGKRIAAWGLTFKAGTDDLRDSPALEVIARLRAAGATVAAYDPTGPTGLAGIATCGDPYEACAGADALVVLTEWEDFARADLAEAAGRMAGARLFDTRAVIDPAAARRAGFVFGAIGLPA